MTIICYTFNVHFIRYHLCFMLFCSELWLEFLYCFIVEIPANAPTFCIVNCFPTMVLCVSYRCPHLVGAVTNHSKHPVTTSTRLQFSATGTPQTPSHPENRWKTPWWFGQSGDRWRVFAVRIAVGGDCCYNTLVAEAQLPPIVVLPPSGVNSSWHRVERGRARGFGTNYPALFSVHMW